MADILRQPITGPSAWHGPALAADNRWAVTLAPAMQAELTRAAAAVLARGLRAPDFGCDDFPLPLTAPVLAAALADVLHGRGFVLLRGVPVENQDEAVIRALYWGIGLYLGEAVTQNLAGDYVATISDRGLDVHALNVKPSQTNAEQRPHTDPGDVVALLCLQPARQGGLSRIASTVAIHNHLLAHHPDLLPVLYRGFHHDLRDDASAAAPFGCTPAPVPVFRHRDGALSCVFNASSVKDAQRRMGVTIPEAEMRALDLMVELARSDDFRLDMEFRPGDMQLLNNYTILHWRTAFTDHAEAARRRRLLRLWLRVEDCRPLDPAQAAGYLMGAKVGKQPGAAAAAG